MNTWSDTAPHGGNGETMAAALGIDPADLLDLSASLNPVAPDPRPIVARHLDSLLRYPDDARATAALAEAIGVDRSRLVLTNGGAEAIALVAQLHPVGWADQQDFSLYRRHLTRLDPDGPRWMSDPNNPTGRLAASDERAAVRDEAFYPLATGQWTRGDADTIALGSLTKLFACPGLRLGYVLAPDDRTAAAVRHLRPRWSLSGPAGAAIPDLLAVSDLAAWASAIGELRSQLFDLLAEHSLHAEPGAANYLWVPVAGDLRERLLQHHILVRSGASFGAPDAVRIAVPPPSGLERLARALSQPRSSRNTTTTVTHAVTTASTTPRTTMDDPTARHFQLPTVDPVDEDAANAARARWATRAKPPGSLGQLEDVAVALAAITGVCPPAVVEHPAVVVFAADHGVVADGASAWPSEITGHMVGAMAGGVAAINTFATTVGATVELVDVGVAADLLHLPSVRHHKVRPGTASLAHGPAMTVEEAAAAVAVGLEVGRELIAAGTDCLVAGDMGIGNTTPAAVLIGVLAGALPDTVTGTGAGLAMSQLGHKTALVAAAMERAAGIVDPLELLAEVGGLEIGAMAGLYLAAASARVPFIIDGVIAASAACVADALVPGTAARGLAGHLSTEPAAAVALKHLGLEPLLDLRLRLGEGTGACLAIPLVCAAARALRDMADLPGA